MESTRKEDYIHRVYQEQLLLSMTFCHDAACQAELEKTVDVAAKNAARLYVTEMAKFLAGRLSAPQLSAWLQLSKSSDGQAVVAAESTMTDAMARLGHQMSDESREEVSRNFCPDHPNICVSGSHKHRQEH